MKVLKKIRFKYLLSLLSVSIIPIFLISVFSLRSNRNFYNNQIEQASKSEVRRITSRINENYADVKDLLGSLIFSTYDGINCMTSICGQEGKGKTITESQRLKNYRMFKYICTNLLESASNVDGVYLFCENGHTYSYMVNQNYGLERQYQSDEWYQTLINSGNSLMITDMVELDKNILGNRENCFLVARKFQSMKGNETAVLAVVCKESIFKDVNNNLPWGSSLIIDGQGNVVQGKDKETPLTEEQLKELSGRETADHGILLTDDIKNIFIYGTLDINDWVVVSNISFESYYDVFKRNSRMIILIVLIDVVAILLIVFYMDRNNVKPIVRLAKVMGNTAEQGFLFHNEYEGREDEIGTLYAYYEKMIQQIDILIQEKYTNEIKILKSRLRNLTSQINAHFIFNTLENITCLAQIEGNKQIQVMSKSLGDMLRYSMDFEGDLIHLDKEIFHIRNYLNIQEVRFDNEIYMELLLEEGTEKRNVMKFMLQPIVENAIEHGMADQSTPFFIRISTEQVRENLVIKVRDNGNGMDQKTLEKVRKRIYEPEKVEEEMRCFNIGLVNIHERIQLLFGKEYGLYVESKQGEGTTVILYIPWM